MGLTKAQLEALNISSFPDNTSELITPEILRNYNSASIANTVNQEAYNVDSASFKALIDALDPSGSAASVVALNEFTASQLTINAGYNTFTQSQDTKNSTLATYTASVNSSLTNINSFTASNANTSLNSYTASNDTKWSNLGAQTGSFITESETGSFATSAITASSLITASVSGQTLTFTKGDASTFNITLPTGSGGSTDITALNAFTSSQLTINAGYNTTTASLLIETANLELFSASTLTRLTNIETTTASLNSSVSQLNANTASQQSQINSLIAATGSYSTSSVSLTSLNAFTASQLTINTGYNTFTGSQLTINSAIGASTSSLNSATASLFTSASLGLTTASFAGNTLTFTKGNGTTFGVVIPDVSGSGVPTGTISSSAQITSLGFVSSSVTASSLVTASVAVNVITFTKGDGTTFDLSVVSSGSVTPGTISGSAQITALGFVSSSVTASSIITASVTNDDITFTKGDGSQFTIQVATGSFAISASYAETASFALNGGVTQILAGPNIIVSPLSGQGQVTISSTGTGSGGFNTATGSYGSFYDTTTQINPVANTARSMSFNETAITNGVSISGSINPFNTYIKTENAGVYNLQFSAQLDKTDSGTDSIDIWIRKNGIDLLDTGTTVTLTGNNDKSVAAWNWFVQSAANDYYQIIWSSADTDMRLLSEASSSVHPGIPSVIATVNRVDQFLSNTGSFSGSFTGTFNGYNLTEFTTTSSFNSYTSSNDAKVNSLIASTGSYATTGSNTFTGQQTIKDSLVIEDPTNQLIYTQLAQNNVNGLFQFYQAGGNGYQFNNNVQINGELTASLQEGYAWVGGTGNVSKLVATSSFGGGSTINTGSFATTGSNAFFGTNTFSGAVSFTGSAPSILSQSFSGSLITNLTDIYTDVAAVQQIVTLTSASYAALASGSLTNPNTLYIVSGSTSGGGTTDITSLNAFTASQYISNSFFATTGSNSFNGNQTITGSLNVRTITTLGLNPTPSTANTGSGTNLYFLNSSINGNATPSIYTIADANGVGWTMSGTGITDGAVTSAGYDDNGVYVNITSGNVVNGNSYIGTGPYAQKLIVTGGVFTDNGVVSPGGFTVQNQNGTGNAYGGMTITVDTATDPTNVFSTFAAVGATSEATIQMGLSSYTPTYSGETVPVIYAGGNYNGLFGETDTTITFYSSSIQNWKPTQFKAPVNITGSLAVQGNQIITGNVTISGSATTDLTVVGQIFVSSSATGGTTAPKITVSGSAGTSTINRNSINTRNTTNLAGLLPATIFTNNTSTLDEIGFTVDAAGAGTPNWSTGPAIYVNNDAGDTYPAAFGFQNKANYTDGRVAVLTPLSASAGFTASLQNGYAWVGNGNNQNTQVATSSFGGGSTPAGTVSSSAQILNYGIFATTGSNSFNGAQTITGSLIQSGAVSIEGNTTFINKNGDSSNVILGNNAMSAITGNTINSIAIGAGAMRYATGSNQNVAIGQNALSVTSGSNNFALGSEAMANNSTGNQNVAIGVGALNQNRTGNLNVSIGNDSGFANVSGSKNTYIGPNVGNNHFGNNTVIIGGYSGGGQVLNNNIILSDGEGNVKAQYSGSAWSLQDEIKLNTGTNKPAALVTVGSSGLTVNNSLVTASSIILVTTQSGTGVFPAVVQGKTDGSFTIKHGLGENLQVAYLIINPTA